MAYFGQVLIGLTLLTAMAGVVLSVRCFRVGGEVAPVQRVLVGSAILAILTICALAFALVIGDYRIDYVQRLSDRTMSAGYLLTAVWGGQEGSLAFWACLQSILAAGVVLWSRRHAPRLAAGVGMMMGGLAVFFWFVVWVVSNPFTAAADFAVDGMGLNPLLRTPYMVVHPPTLFVGFAGFSVPLAFAFAALLTDSMKGDWLCAARPWILFAFAFLSVGNLLGMVWAYQELGWGGYWGWDPVENASLMPWLTGVALVHSAVADRRRQILRGWSLFLIVVTFLLVIFGTFLTRSGIVQSVHAFSESETGPWFLGLIAVIGIGVALMAMWRRPSVADARTPSVWRMGNEWLFTLLNWILVFATFLIWVATLWPLFTQIVTGGQVMLSPAFFNRMMVPFGVGVLLLLGLSNGVSWTGVRTKGMPILTGGAVAGIAALGWGVGADWRGDAVDFSMAWAPLVMICVVVFAGVSVVAALCRAVITSGRNAMGSQVVHVGLLLLFVGFAGAGFGEVLHVNVAPGDFFFIDDTKVTFTGIRVDADSQQEAVFADLAVTEDLSHGRVVAPSRHYYYSHPQMPIGEVAIVSSPARDLFFSLGEVDFERGHAVIKALVNPLVFWIWAGGCILVLGLVLVATDKRWWARWLERVARGWQRAPIVGMAMVGTGVIWGVSGLVLGAVWWVLVTGTLLLLWGTGGLVVSMSAKKGGFR